MMQSALCSVLAYSTIISCIDLNSEFNDVLSIESISILIFLFLIEQVVLAFTNKRNLIGLIITSVTLPSAPTEMALL